ncbi:MAG: FAD:protein FMN transferase [Gemmatimonadota bacterium]|nr:MAG: FAD:protein FMN transferase [Gemmatimonadota bacterium]
MHKHEPTRTAGPSRREVLLLGVGAFAVATVPLLRGRRRLVRRSVPVMGTIADIAVVHRDEQYAQAAIDAAIEQLRYVDRTMTTYSESSDVGRANRQAGKAPVTISQATATVVEQGLQWAQSSDGAFDPCIGAAVDLWDVKSRSTPPDTKRVGQLAGRNLYRSVDLGSHQGRPVIRMTDDAAALDLGGIAKGYGVDRAVQSLREWGIEDALVNAGGDLYAMGESEDGDPWSIGVRSPFDPAKVTHKFDLTDEAVATSGDYLQNFKHAGMTYHHLLDPATASPRDTMVHSVTVAADNCMAADAAATTVFGMDQTQALRIMAVRGLGTRVVSSL